MNVLRAARIPLLLSRRARLAVWMLWHGMAGLALVGLPSQLRLGKSLVASSPEHLVFLAKVFAAYMACVLLLAWQTRGGRKVHLGGVALAMLAFFGACALALLVRQSYYSPFVLLASFVLSGASVALSFLVADRWLLALTATAAIVTASAQPLNGRPKAFIDGLQEEEPEPSVTQKIIDSRFYPIKATFYDDYFDVCDAEENECDAPRNGGGIAQFSNGYLVATGEGLLHFATVDPGNRSLSTKLVPLSIPIDSDAFSREGPGDLAWLFRVMDILVLERGQRFTLFASHHYWKSAERCFVVRVSKLEGETAAFLSGDLRDGWQTLFETKPCLPLKNAAHGKAFAGDESGGRMAMLDSRTLLLTVGDHQFDGWNSDRALAQDPDNDYGKTIAIDLASGKSQLYTLGHRNPQGLFVGEDHRVWSTEHGPSGGDELNLLVKGRNYGWPLVTYGVEYLMNEWPLNKTPGDHPGFERPVFSWMPSIAVSNLIGVQGKRFPLWQGDLLICSYLDSLFRARVRDGRVAYVEHIEVRERDGRLRDIMEDRDGRIVLWLDGGSLAFLEPAASAIAPGVASQAMLRGRALFSTCATCHKVGDGTSHGTGPDLAGIAGRTIGSAPGFHYSAALGKRSGENWTDEQLDRFLASPAKAVPGTAMQFDGVTSPEDRAALIAYLKTLKPR